MARGVPVAGAGAGGWGVGFMPRALVADPAVWPTEYTDDTERMRWSCFIFRLFSGFGGLLLIHEAFNDDAVLGSEIELPTEYTELTERFSEILIPCVRCIRWAVMDWR